MGTHWCGCEQARDRFQLTASAHGIGAIDLAAALTAAAARSEGVLCSPAVVTAVISVMKPDASAPHVEPGPSSDDTVVAAVLSRMSGA
jgi:hypothetical protein